jgi:uncharacterized protein (TIGR04255 family)
VEMATSHHRPELVLATEAGCLSCRNPAILLPMTNAPTPQLRNPPIVEAVFDVDCDLPPGFDLAALEERSRAQFRDHSYPKFRPLFLQEHQIQAVGEQPKMSSRLAVQAFQFLHEDERQILQIRAQGFSFNRLAPYTSLDDYLPEIERTWRLYVDLVSPVQIRTIQLRYINRILVPMSGPTIDLDEFLKIGPRSPDEESLLLSGFLNQIAAIEKHTREQVNLVLTAQLPVDGRLPLILDIAVASNAIAEPADWSSILRLIGSLRTLKNRVFMNSLTPACIQLFQ